MSRVRVLVVDDQAPFRRAASAVIGAIAEFELVGTADSGEAAMDAVRACRPDLVVMDVGLPGISGLEATRRITTDPLVVGTRVVVVSTYDAEDLGDELLTCGADGFLGKASFDPDRLLAAWRALTS